MVSKGTYLSAGNLVLGEYEAVLAHTFSQVELVFQAYRELSNQLEQDFNSSLDYFKGKFFDKNDELDNWRQIYFDNILKGSSVKTFLIDFEEGLVSDIRVKQSFELMRLDIEKLKSCIQGTGSQKVLFIKKKNLEEMSNKLKVHLTFLLIPLVGEVDKKTEIFLQTVVDAFQNSTNNEQSPVQISTDLVHRNISHILQNLFPANTTRNQNLNLFNSPPWIQINPRKRPTFEASDQNLQEVLGSVGVDANQPLEAALQDTRSILNAKKVELKKYLLETYPTSEIASTVTLVDDIFLELETQSINSIRNQYTQVWSNLVGSQQPFSGSSLQQQSFTDFSLKPYYPVSPQRPISSASDRTPLFSGSEQPIFPGSLENPTFTGSSSQQIFPGSPEQQTFPGSSPQQIFSGSSPSSPQQNFPESPKQKIFPGSSPQQIFPGSSPQQVFPGSSPQQIFPGSSTQQVFPGSSQQQIFPGSGGKPVLPDSIQQQTFLGSSPQQIFPGSSQQQIFPGSSPQQIFPGSSPQQIFPGSSPQQIFPGSSQQQIFPGSFPQQTFPAFSQPEQYPGSINLNYFTKQNHPYITAVQQILESLLVRLDAFIKEANSDRDKSLKSLSSQLEESAKYKKTVVILNLWKDTIVNSAREGFEGSINEIDRIVMNHNQAIGVLMQNFLSQTGQSGGSNPLIQNILNAFETQKQLVEVALNRFITQSVDEMFVSANTSNWLPKAELEYENLVVDITKTDVTNIFKLLLKRTIRSLYREVASPSGGPGGLHQQVFELVDEDLFDGVGATVPTSESDKANTTADTDWEKILPAVYVPPRTPSYTVNHE